MANVGALREAVRTSNISLVKRLVKGGVCVDERLWTGILILVAVITTFRPPAFFRCLVSNSTQGINQDEDTSLKMYGRTLLQECVTLSDVDMVKSLIEYGEADVNAQNDDGKTALHIASRAGSLDIVSLLLEAGAHTDTQCLDGTTSLHLAMWKNKSQVVEKLIKAGANPNLQDQDHWTPLHWGVQSRNLDLVKLLVENGANMDVVNKSLLTPFTLSLKICNFPIAKYMLFMGAGVRIINETKKTPKSVISLLLRPEVVTKEEMDVPKFVMLLVENGYCLWRDAELQSGQVMADKKCEIIRQFLLSQISDPPKLLNFCRNKVWNLLHRKRAGVNFSGAIRSLQIPAHLQDFLLSRAELQFQQLLKNSRLTANKFCTDTLPGSELKKTGMIRLKKTSSPLPSGGKEIAKLEQNHPSTSKCNEHTDALSKKIIPTRIVFNEPPKKSIATRIVFNEPPKKSIATRIVFNDPPKKIVPNNPSQTTEDTSFIKCQVKERFLNLQPILNPNMSRSFTTPSSKDGQRTPCKKEGIKQEILKRVLSTDASNMKNPVSDKVRRLCRFNFDTMPASSEFADKVEGHAKKRRAWKTEEPVS